ncbi:hypothetical protein DFH09DRAFT_1307224 [Mycena vulgaris]|nr:hypothetical protein DFH09DRAFT_1307224 [Mycena vulgaris]
MFPSSPALTITDPSRFPLPKPLLSLHLFSRSWDKVHLVAPRPRQSFLCAKIDRLKFNPNTYTCSFSVWPDPPRIHCTTRRCRRASTAPATFKHVHALTADISPPGNYPHGSLNFCSDSALRTLITLGNISALPVVLVPPPRLRPLLNTPGIRGDTGDPRAPTPSPSPSPSPTPLLAPASTLLPRRRNRSLPAVGVALPEVKNDPRVTTFQQLILVWITKDVDTRRGLIPAPLAQRDAVEVPSLLSFSSLLSSPLLSE